MPYIEPMEFCLVFTFDNDDRCEMVVARCVVAHDWDEAIRTGVERIEMEFPHADPWMLDKVKIEFCGERTDNINPLWKWTF